MTPSPDLVVGLAGLAGLSAWVGLGSCATNPVLLRAGSPRPYVAAGALAAAVALGGVVAAGAAQQWASARVGVGACGAVAVVLVARRLVTGRRERGLRQTNELAVLALCDAMSAELRAGTPAPQALDRACENRSDWSSLLVTSRLGGDVAARLRDLAGQPGQRGLRAVAAAWEVSARSGLALADVLDRVAGVLRDEQDARAEVLATLSPARATARLLAALPVFGLGLGSSIGARPLHILLTTTLGVGCLAAGAVLAAVGVLWVDHIAAVAED